MEICVFHDKLTTITSIQSLGHGFSKLHLNRQGNISYTSNFSSAGGFLRISAGISTVDAIVRPPVKSSSIKTLPRRMMKKRRRTRRKSSTGDDGNDDAEGWNFGGFSGEGFDAGGPIDNNGGMGGGKGWNFGGFGGSDWGEFFSNNSYNDPAFDFVFEVLSWIVFSNCLDFAYKKVMKFVADGLANAAKQKVALRLAPVY